LAASRGCQCREGYGVGHTNEPEEIAKEELANPLVALLPLIVVGVLNKVFTVLIPQFYRATNEVRLAGMDHSLTTPVSSVTAIWAVQGALIMGVLTVLVFAFRPVSQRFADGTKAAVAGSLLATMNTASEYGFGAVISSLPGFLVIKDALKAIPNPLVNEAITVTVLAGITGSASGGGNG
jgi:H+/gluconate symporter-like permease